MVSLNFSSENKIIPLSVFIIFNFRGMYVKKPFFLISLYISMFKLASNLKLFVIHVYIGGMAIQA